LFSPDHPLIVQSDGSILVDAHHARYDEAREALAPYAELVTAPEHVHTYRLSAISVWNALALGRTAADVKIDVGRFSQHGIPGVVLSNVDGWAARYGRIRLENDEEGLVLRCADPLMARELVTVKSTAQFLGDPVDDTGYRIDPIHRGEIKWALIKHGYPVEDAAGFVEAEPMRIRVRDGDGFSVRDYQRAAAETFAAAGAATGGHGVIVLPCGAGKTLVGLLAMEKVGASTLIIATSTAAVDQWRREIKDRTDIPDEAVGTYTGAKKDVRPITIATYSVVSLRRNGVFPHLSLFRARSFGLVIYDEVHLLPAPVFRMTASLQAVRRLGLTATLVREDGKADDVYALIGPKRYDVPWKVLEKRSFIAGVECAEVRVPLDPVTRARYAGADLSQRFRIAASSQAKDAVVADLLARHPERPALVLGVYVDQLTRLGEVLDCPVVTGDTPNAKREVLYTAFREGRLKRLVLSRVGSLALDLPSASLAIEVSGTFGSRQEEAQRVGRLLRPKEDVALFFTVVSTDTSEQDAALRRQRFLAEQGYRYTVVDVGIPAVS
jgi:DNA excision repair protein ERCC-3